MLRIGTRVVHRFGHGHGTVVAQNNNERQPYVVRFDTGHEDVYAPADLVLVNTVV